MDTDLSSSKWGLILSGVFTVCCSTGILIINSLGLNKVVEYELLFSFFTLVFFFGLSFGSFLYYNVVLIRNLVYHWKAGSSPLHPMTQIEKSEQMN